MFAETLPCSGDRLHLKCPRCGEYTIGGSLDAQLRHPVELNRTHFALMGAVRAATSVGEEVAILDQADIDSLRKREPTTVEGKAIHLLKMFSRMMEHPAAVANFDFDSYYPLAYASNPSEFEYYFSHLERLGLVEVTWKSLPAMQIRLTVEGWKRIEAERKSGLESDQGFVAMWFADEMDGAYRDGIRPAIEDAGFKPLRIDATPHNGKICDKIIAEIRSSRFLVADFTGSRGGVYFEAGFAMGLGLPVVWLCRGDHLKEVHFDTRHYNHIVWNKPEELREALADRIKATIGKPVALK